MKKSIRGALGLLEHPVKIGIAAFVIAFLSLLFEGTLMDLWKLNQERDRILSKHVETLKKNDDLKLKIEQARHSDQFIGRQAREKLDLLKQDELVFIFENEHTLTPSVETPE